MSTRHLSGPVRRLARPRAARPSPRPSPWSSSSPTSSSRRPASRCWAGSRRRASRSPRCPCCPSCGEDRRTFCLTAAPGRLQLRGRPFTLVIQFLVLGGALLTALLSIDTRQGRTTCPPASTGSCCSPRPPARPCCPPPATSPPSSSPSKSPRCPPSRWSALRRGDRLSSEAALKFFLSSVAATAVMLLGVSFVYAATGSLHLSQVGRRASPPSPTRGWTPWPRPASRSPSSASPSRPPPPPSTSGCPTPTSARRCPIAALPLRGRQGGRLLRPHPGHRPRASPRTRTSGARPWPSSPR